MKPSDLPAEQATKIEFLLKRKSCQGASRELLLQVIGGADEVNE